MLFCVRDWSGNPFCPPADGWLVRWAKRLGAESAVPSILDLVMKSKISAKSGPDPQGNAQIIEY